MYFIVMSNGTTHRVTADVALRIASTRNNGIDVFCDPFGDPHIWVNPRHVVQIVPVDR